LTTMLFILKDCAYGIEGTRRSTLDELARRTLVPERVLVF